MLIPNPSKYIRATRIIKSGMLGCLAIYKPYDKAGSYRVQEWIGYIGIQRIEGCFFNVMGLPVNKLYRRLKKYFQ